LFDYSTIEEKAAEWGITCRHVQNLCRENRIEGAVKRGGVWFIPNETPSPVQNTKSGVGPFRFEGTKKKIFENAIQLFMHEGYENVSMQDIAEAVGIRQSALYNHFRSKQELLDTIYDFYIHHWLYNRLTLDDIEKLFRTESLFDVITKGFIYEFDKDILEQMSGIASIVFQRAATDKRAADLLMRLNLKEGIEFVEKALNRAIEVGRIAPIDTHTISVLINCSRIYMLLWWIINPPQEVFQKALKDEQALYKIAASLLTDRKLADTESAATEPPGA